ncbi:MAG TPA: ABC transporter permease [Acidimicrobiales bacterium]|nr:ABC transporter permease [Acidimicrobiales bacterium]
MATVPAVRVASYFGRAYARTWRASIMTTFVNPLLYLLAMGVGLGSFINRSGHTGALGHLSYLHFVAPALAAAAGATTAASESMFPVMGAIKWQRTYYAMLATPLRVVDVLAGHLLWIGARVTMAVGSYLVVMACFGATPSVESVAILPVGVLTGMAFATPLAAFAATQDSDGSFSLVFRLGIVPLFLFSGVFFPLSQLPEGLRILAYVTPLWHGVALCRALAGGQATAAGVLGHGAYLLAVAAAGAVVARLTYRRRLLV